MPTDVVLLGEALVGYSSIDRDLRQASTFRRFVGGAELNVAVALHRLGKAVLWHGVVGSDAHGDVIDAWLRDEGLPAVLLREAGTTGLMFKGHRPDGDPEVLQVRRHSAFAEHAISAALLALETTARHLHTTGLPLVISPQAREAQLRLMRAARERGLTVSFDPNLRPGLWSGDAEIRRVFDHASSLATVVMPGRSEGEALTGHADPRRIAEYFLELGCDEVVVKSGASGAEAFSRDAWASAAPLPIVAVDTVGAGDGFAAAYLDAMLDGADLSGRLSWGAAMGAFVTTVRGDCDAMPTRQRLEQWMKEIDAVRLG